MEAKHLYIEPTSHCNLDCAMCSRNFWQHEATGHMDMAVFDAILANIPPSVDRIFFGGVGEPLCHPEIHTMVHRAKATGRRVELITNGTLLSDDIIEALITAPLDELWISLDSLHEDSVAGQDGDTGQVLQNIRKFNRARGSYFNNGFPQRCALGIAFVLTKDNLPAFRHLLDNAYTYVIDDIKATHLIPYDIAQKPLTLYEELAERGLYPETGTVLSSVDLPFMRSKDLVENDLQGLYESAIFGVSVLQEPVRRRQNYCRFVNEGYVFVRWDGEVVPCMALLHENRVYQRDTTRQIQPKSFGNVTQTPLPQIWDDSEYVDFRTRVIDFNFSPCFGCGSCELFETNETDCFGSPFPTCGGCLWAQGLFQCP